MEYEQVVEEPSLGKIASSQLTDGVGMTEG